MRSLDQLFGEFAAAFQFPAYFGDNWHAFDECLGELDWLGVDGGVAVVIEQAEMVLEADQEQFERFVRAIGYAASEWAATTELGLGSGRPAMRFVVVAHMSESISAKGREVWEAAGVEFGDYLSD